MANERKPKLPLEVIDDAGNMLINKKEVIDKWKNDYENLYYENIGQSFDGNHLHQIKQLLENSIYDGSLFTKAD